jgi:hypothetical protein
MRAYSRVANFDCAGTGQRSSGSIGKKFRTALEALQPSGTAMAPPPSNPLAGVVAAPRASSRSSAAAAAAPPPPAAAAYQRKVAINKASWEAAQQGVQMAMAQLSVAELVQVGLALSADPAAGSKRARAQAAGRVEVCRTERECGLCGEWSGQGVVWAVEWC